jgi:hypothetical protein
MNMSNYSSLYIITVRPHISARGNRHGYTQSDYARDAAVAINRQLEAQGYASTRLHEDIEICRRHAQRLIDACDAMIAAELYIEFSELRAHYEDEA